MTSRPRPSRIARWRVPAAALLAAHLAPADAEPLFVRIRVHPDPVEAARAAREAVWARSQARARIVIASVCTGCLGPWAAPAGPPSPDPRGSPFADATAAAPAGLEPAPPPGASEPPIRERRP